MPEGEGPRRWVSGDGRPLSEYCLEGGQLHGEVKTWYPSGGPRFTGTFVHGRREGLFVWWHPTGALARIETYRDGRREGECFSWDRSGGRGRRGVYRQGRKLRRTAS